MSNRNFQDLFCQATGYAAPFDYQVQFAQAETLPTLIEVPTGLGKLATVVLGWLWRRRYAPDAIRQQTPRRLAYCLPTRTLVEQAHEQIQEWLANLALESDVGLYLLMGGAVAQNWDGQPEKDLILVGTQEQLVSRALNRGYAMSRYRWPIQYAQLNNDVLWVMDETQLMGITVATTAQLQGFREQFGTYGPTHSIWMSATLAPSLLNTPDFQPNLQAPHAVLRLTDQDLQSRLVQQRLRAVKTLQQLNLTLPKQTKQAEREAAYVRALAQAVWSRHEPGTLTLVICNRVRRAQGVYQHLAAMAAKTPGWSEKLALVHSRFRFYERQQQVQTIRAFRTGQATGLLVTTQAVEAGVDLSAKHLITELAPWFAMVQRFGRCNRKGEFNEAYVYWVEPPDALPYTAEELDRARGYLQQLSDVSLQRLMHLGPLGEPLEIPDGLIPRRKDILDLFDTSADLAGHDIDISRLIRDTDNLDVYVAWRDWQGDKPDQDLALQRDELCPVRLAVLRDFLETVKEKGKAWIWKGEWTVVESLYPGQQLLLHCNLGGYDSQLGFTGHAKHKPKPVPVSHHIPMDADNRDILSFTGRWESLPDHALQTANQARQLCQVLGYSNLPVEAVVRAAQWHDAGKAHPVFQAMLCRDEPTRQNNGLWAKAPPQAQPYDWPPERQGFRHELVSALMALQQGQPFLIAYLVACHHGKVRLVIQPRPQESAPVPMFALGVHEGDQTPAVDLGSGLQIPPLTLSLEVMQLGPGSWVEQARGLLDTYGPFRLAFLEMLVRLADWRASALPVVEQLE
ncbi:MAG: CRISPR-associated helicase Cas3' [Gloeomargarita sp. SKYBB_i_bin120]|nr:CRISPR-associated helicase Cas3' [Gloeomargarita sp. SKYB120]MDW8178856.1 CRISPR-associated helicase Cas3' [Gloeomargarita sp. SKYBB_i_bin120]